MMGLIACLVFTGCEKKYEEVVLKDPETESARETTIAVTTAAALEETEAEPEPEERIEVNGTIKSYLTGEMVDVAKADRRPVAVMMSNDKAALPQYGLGRAGVVYEAPVEGGMNRFMAIIEDYDDLERIGSVRSCRTYYTYFAREFDAVYAHYGQSTFAEPYLENVDNINGLTGTGGTAYYRSRDKKAPHNAYTSGEKLKQAIEKLGYSNEYSDSYQGHYQFAKNGEAVLLDQSDAVDACKVVPGYVLNQPWFEYSEDDGLYHRYQYGTVHRSAEGPLTAKNIIIQYCQMGHYATTEYLNIDLHTSREGYYITNGKAIPVRWKKDSEFGPTRYYDSEGKEITLNQGKTWVCVMSVTDMSKTEIYGK
ncbi:MAG: DUF3048 domain-containing protein [Lachnospiraceae bacterium]